ncbi:FAD-binding protein, partial [Francisella tularensis subsp. holarctica]|uniref:FAD-binding protein n=1 Tax=Francisella tularensis TaxID=263 RepID=UPI002381BD3C
CAAADRTGHPLLNTLKKGNLEHKTELTTDWFADDMVKADDGRIAGVIAHCIETGETVIIKANITIISTGGAGRIYD